MLRKKVKPVSVIKNYGLMWRRNAVFWGKPGKHGRGQLLGRRSRKIINFNNQVGVYVLYDESRRPVYVGQAGQGNARLFSRLNNHRKNHLAHRWQYFSWFGLLVVNMNGSLSGRANSSKRVRGILGSSLNEIEGALIAAMEPPNNKQGAKFGNSDRYAQVIHREEEGATIDTLYEMLEDVRTKLRNL